MKDNYIHIRSFNPLVSIFIRVGISIQTQIDSRLENTRTVALKEWSSPIFNEQDQIVKSRASMQQVDKGKLTAWLLMVFVLIATLCSIQWAAFTTFVGQAVRPSLTEEGIQRGSKKRAR